MISKESLEEYKTLYKKHFNKDLTDQEALESATKLLTLMKAVYKPITQADLDFIERRRRDGISGKGQ